LQLRGVAESNILREVRSFASDGGKRADCRAYTCRASHAAGATGQNAAATSLTSVATGHSAAVTEFDARDS